MTELKTAQTIFFGLVMLGLVALAIARSAQEECVADRNASPEQAEAFG